MEEDYRSGLEEILAGKPSSGASEGGSSTLPTLFTVQVGGAVDLDWGHIVGRWKKYFEDLLNPTDLPSNEEAEAGVSEVDSSITQAEVTEDDVVLMASSGQDLQHVLERFAAECEAAGMRISTSKSGGGHGSGSRPEKGGMPSPGGWRGPASSGGVQVSLGSCSRVRERSAVSA
ncbi:hypothetical protein L3Q82_009228 [Scortum barcoo]|uniref:Uncharacterized protein n=1 Tax=Scortum barcoo TaxID=214431 RepID=A0ACB8WFK0_9TELE|nr:hypothetical protein L3Q82_009228 [Scortum barcoo]